MRRTGLLPVLLALVAGPAAGQAPVVYRVPISGTIENGLAPYAARALDAARAARADAVVLDIDTPGGRIDAAERIVDAIRASEIPVYAFVNPRAYSAGALIALATKGIYVRPGGVIGAATPVDGQGTKASEKIVSAMRGEFRALAEEAGLDPAVAEGMVDETLDIPGIKPPGRLLTLTAEEALRLGYAKEAVADLPAMTAAVGLGGAQIVNVDMNWTEYVVRFLTSPLVSPLLLSLGMLGLIFEIKAGHFGVGGLVSVTSLGLFFGSSAILGLAGWEEVILLALGFVALGIEIFVLPGFGIAGLLGLGLIGTSIVLAMVSGMPTGGDLVQALAVIGAAAVITGAVLFAWIRHLPHSERFRRVLLQDGLDAAEGYVSAAPRGDLIGKVGTAFTDLRPSGTAMFDGERVDVVTEGDYVKQGMAVKVIRSDGYRHVVRPAAELAAAGNQNG
ncbi:MAG: NfeD family protein, partial [Gemmatimonadales bacterium]